MLLKYSHTGRSSWFTVDCSFSCNSPPIIECGMQGGSKKPKIEGSKDDIFGGESGKGRKRTEEGYVIYTEDELKLGTGGGDTELCPFDCDCCF